MTKTILDLCGGTGSWSKPYRDAGYNVVTVDVLDGGDVRLLERVPNVHGVLAAPPCTHFSASGARWWKDKGQQALLEGLSVVDACLRIIHVANPQWWALENPVGRLKRYLGEPVLYFDPCHYGDPYTKKLACGGASRRRFKPLLSRQREARCTSYRRARTAGAYVVPRRQALRRRSLTLIHSVW